MADVSDLIGAALPPQVVVVERGAVSNFATAVTADDPVFHSADAAAAEGLPAVAAPPTWSLVMGNWGAFPELQPDGADDDSPVTAALGRLMADGGMILHGEQAFRYHRPVVAGDVLHGTGRIADVYVKDGAAPMTFVVAETTWCDPDGGPVVDSTMTLIHRAPKR